MADRIQLSRNAGFRLPPNTVKVARPSKWGNPFRVGVHGEQGACVELFERCIADFPIPTARVAEWRAAGGDLEMLVALASRCPRTTSQLRGKHLACWCGPGEKCHADVLMRICLEPFRGVPMSNGVNFNRLAIDRLKRLTEQMEQNPESVEMTTVDLVSVLEKLEAAKALAVEQQEFATAALARDLCDECIRLMVIKGEEEPAKAAS